MRIVNKKNLNAGFSLVELIVTVAVVAILGAFMFSSFTNVLNVKRKEADMEKLFFIDSCVEQIFVHKDAFEEAKKLVVDGADGNKNTLTLHFPLGYDSSLNVCTIEMDDATVNSQTDLLSDKSTILTNYLIEYVGKTIELDFPAYRSGEYVVTVVFNGNKVSSVREYTLSNDNITVTNSGDTRITEG